MKQRIRNIKEEPRYEVEFRIQSVFASIGRTLMENQIYHEEAKKLFDPGCQLHREHTAFQGAVWQYSDSPSPENFDLLDAQKRALGAAILDYARGRERKSQGAQRGDNETNKPLDQNGRPQTRPRENNQKENEK